MSHESECFTFKVSHICVLSVWLHKSFSILNVSLYRMTLLLGWIVKGEQNGHFHSIPVLCLVMCNSLGAESFSPGVSQHLSDVTVSNSWYRAMNVFRITVSFFPVWYSLTGTVMLHPFHPCYIKQWEIQLFFTKFYGKISMHQALWENQYAVSEIIHREIPA